ncbi:large-conductance mechanosensitive channel [Panaeolus papilionaceus]|nr:large-conductance mechanosensitive channel [Panaeolus papilionaceus]
MPPSSQWVADESQVGLISQDRIKSKVRGIWDGFLDFALRDNVLEVAVGLIIASSFTGLVNSMVSDVLLPPLSLLFLSRNIEEKFLILRKGPNWADGYNTRKQATDDGAVILTYGAFLYKLVSFVAIGFVLYLIASLYGYFSHDSIIKHTSKCPYCRKEISQKAKRCPLCTSWLDGREDKESSAIPSHSI